MHKMRHLWAGLSVLTASVSVLAALAAAADTYYKEPPAHQSRQPDHRGGGQYGNPSYAPVLADLKAQLLTLREGLGETDESYPHIQKIIDAHWDG